MQIKTNDVELGVVPADKSVQMNIQCDADKDDTENTHVLIPRPGYIIVVGDAKGSEDCCSDNKTKVKKSSLSCKQFFCTSKVG